MVDIIEKLEEYRQMIIEIRDEMTRTLLDDMRGVLDITDFSDNSNYKLFQDAVNHIEEAEDELLTAQILIELIIKYEEG